MGIISTLKSVLGVGGDRRERTRDRGTAVTVEREPDASGERAVKGHDAPASSDGPSTAAADEEEPAADEGEPVDAIKGIGAAYAASLADAGVHTVADLAGADPGELAETTRIGEGRIEGWIERARARTG